MHSSLYLLLDTKFFPFFHMAFSALPLYCMQKYSCSSATLPRTHTTTEPHFTCSIFSRKLFASLVNACSAAVLKWECVCSLRSFPRQYYYYYYYGCHARCACAYKMQQHTANCEYSFSHFILFHFYAAHIDGGIVTCSQLVHTQTLTTLFLTARK